MVYIILVYIMTYYYSHLVLYIDIIYDILLLTFGAIYVDIIYDILLLTFGATYRYYIWYIY